MVSEGRKLRVASCSAMHIPWSLLLLGALSTPLLQKGTPCLGTWKKFSAVWEFCLLAPGSVIALSNGW